jgi:phosphotransferase system enzyme I (PtsP)
MHKDTVELVCNVGELVSLFESKAGIEGFLQKVVSLVAYHMKAAVCSVFMFDEATQELVLTANQGLNPDFIGKFRLKLGEGLIGHTLKTLRPVREARATENPKFKRIQNFGEENFLAFLAVPITLGNRRVGVLAVQDPQPDYFDDNDVKALRAIAAQLAGTIEGARLLMGIEKPSQTPAPKSNTEQEQLDIGCRRFIRGIAASDGIAMGRAMDITSSAQDWLSSSTTSIPLTEDDFHRAMKRTEEQLADIQRQVGERMSDVATLIFDAHVLILKDAGFSGDMLDRIRQGQSPDQAVREVVLKYVDIFSKSSHPAMREKVLDVQDLGLRLISNLLAAPDEAVDYTGRIVIANEMRPSDLLKLSAQKAEGLILVGGGVTAHISVLARSLHIPLVVVYDPIVLRPHSEGETLLILDSEQGSILVDPAQDVIERYRIIIEENRRLSTSDIKVLPETSTRDGVRVQLLANVNLLSEVTVAQRFKAEGIGLYRSEFPFIVRNYVPSEEEQFRIYSRLLDSMPGGEVVLRTLDVGGDKILSYYPTTGEANPFLGLRAIRFSLRNKDIFGSQLRAMLRAGTGRQLNIMFPLVSSLDDFWQAREVVEGCAQALRSEGIPHNAHPRLGVMIEIPSAVELAYDLAQAADFMCIGTNDLIQYTLAVDRTNESIADYYVPHHPAVLRAINRIVLATTAAGKPLSVCGDMAGDETLVPFLIGIGIRKLSMEARRIPKIQQVIASVTATASRSLAEDLLKFGSIKDVEARLGLSFQPSRP